MKSLRSFTYVQRLRYILCGPEYKILRRTINVSWWRAAWCRFRGHPNGIIYYTHALATEPDTRCKDCGEDLG